MSKIEQTKTCSKCGEIKSIELFHKRGEKRRGVCAKCTKIRFYELKADGRYYEAKRKWEIKNKDKINAKSLARYHNDIKGTKEIHRISDRKRKDVHKQWVIDNPEIRKISSKKYQKKAQIELRDCYVRSCLMSKKNEVDEKIIDLKRQLILNRRALKEFKNVTKT